jgi:hypothetical protein
VCTEVLGSEMTRSTNINNQNKIKKHIYELIQTYCRRELI